MTICSREQLKERRAPRREKVDLPEFGNGHYVWIYGLNAGEKNQHDAWLLNKRWDGIDRKKAALQKEHLLVMTIRDDDGKQILELEDVTALQQWPADVLNRCFDVANRLSGGTTDRNDLKKNSEDTADD